MIKGQARVQLTSEDLHEQELNHIQFKFDRMVFKKTKEERKELKKIKLNLARPFANETLMQFNTDNENPLDVKNKIQLSHKSKKDARRL